jgi:hypothetical protein
LLLTRWFFKKFSVSVPCCSRFFQISRQLLLSAGLSMLVHAWQPGTGIPAAADGFSVDVTNRRDVLAFHHCVYQASQNYEANLAWTGNISSGDAGATSQAFKVNYYRALAGLPADIVFSATKSAKCQKAALMMSANNALDHNPPTSWIFYSVDGKDAAAASNLALGYYGPAAVDGYILEPGVGNELVGHRRWLLYQRAREMATGDIPRSGTYNPSNSLWVIGDYKAAPPAKFVAWPNEGYTPSPLLPARWSLSYPGADFKNATVSMSLNGSDVAVTVVSRNQNGYGENTIVWQPASLPGSVTADLPYVVNVTGIKGSGVPTSKSYTVRVFNPDILGDQVTITGSDNPPATGAPYAFNSIEQADSYELEVATTTPTAWTEGAEDAPAPLITSAISAGYNLRQSGLVRTGSKAFQMTFPFSVWADQSFTIERDIVPSSGSLLLYADRARYTHHLNTLETRISTDGGASWTTIASRNGVNVAGYSSEWDSAWINRSISLAGYAGQIVKLRFIMKTNGAPAYQGTTSSYGFFIDDITVTNTSEAVSTRTMLAGNPGSFTLDHATAGQPLEAGTTYHLRIRPNVGTRWFSFGPAKIVTVPAPPSPTFSNWASGLETSHGLAAGTLTDPDGDDDGDGRCNLLEYAFGGSPLSSADPVERLPASRIEGGDLVLQYRVDTALADLSVVPESCPAMTNWKAPGEPGAPAGFTDQLIATEGTIQTREARLPLASGSRCFLRLRVSRQP